MMRRMAPSISLAIALFAAMAAVALRAATRRPVTTDEGRSRTAVTSGPPGQPVSVAEQMQRVFHELHADGQHALCAVCDGQYGLA
jgi:hypothetical protein